jgi:hypothetical protein
MSTLKQVESAMRGDKGNPQTEQFFNNTSSIDVSPQTEVKYHVFRLVKKKKGRIYIDSIGEGVNPNTKRRERIWLINGADTIWQSELLKIYNEKDLRQNRQLSPTFENGILRVPSWDTLRVEFLRNNIKNVGSLRSGNGKFDYYEYDAAAEQAMRHKKQLLKIDMVIKAKEMPVEKMKKLASFLGISFVDELGMPKGDDGVRTELMMKADSFPEQFEKYIDSDEVDVQYMVKKAIIEAKIDLTGQNGNALWAGGKGFICKIPVGRKPYEYLTELAMTNSDEGKKFKEELQTFAK